MKFKITKAEYDALSDAMKLMYVVDGDGYKMPLTDVEDPAELRRALIREKANANAATDKLTVMQAELDALKTDPARKSGDIKVIEDSWKQKLADSEAASKTRIETLTATLNKTLIDNAAKEVAAAITDPAKPGNAALMIPHIRSRFEVVMDGDTPIVKIKDATGRLSAMNTAELQKELVADAKYATVVVGSKASGAGGTGGAGSKTGGSGGAAGDKKFAEMNGQERTALFNSNRAEFDRLAAEDKAAKNNARFTPVRLHIA